jgi:hypothetical protein
MLSEKWIQTDIKFKRLVPNKIRDIQTHLEPNVWQIVLPLYLPTFADKIVITDEIIQGNKSTEVIVAFSPTIPNLQYGNIKLVIYIWKCFRGKGLGREVLSSWTLRKNSFVRVWRGNAVGLYMLTNLPNWKEIALAHHHYIFKNLD